MSNNPFKRKTYFEKRVGEFIFKWFFNEKKPKECYLRIETTSRIWGMTVAGGTHAYGYLLAAAKQDLDKQLSGYAMYNYVVATSITPNQGFLDGLAKEINKMFKRFDKEAETAAKAVTDEQEQADQALMEDIASEQGLSKKELKVKREADREVMREVLNEVKEGKS